MMHRPSSKAVTDRALMALEGQALVLVDAAALSQDVPDAPIRVVVDRDGITPMLDPADWDGMVTTRLDAPAPWVGIAPDRIDAQIARVRRMAAIVPVAAAMLAQVLRTGEHLPFDKALDLESLAYSTLLGGGEFAHWRATHPISASGAPPAADPVRYERVEDVVTVVLASPGTRNAMTAAMRDALYEALGNVVDDPSRPQLILRAQGACFSTGGDLGEFGSAKDLARAHMIRTARSSARLLHDLGDRAQARVHGACIGSGIEIPAAAARRRAAPDTFVQLPELTMGLIPGAGGTVSVARAIGRHRLAWMMLGNFRIGAQQALRWGLFDEIVA